MIILNDPDYNYKSAVDKIVIENIGQYLVLIFFIFILAKNVNGLIYLGLTLPIIWFRIRNQISRLNTYIQHLSIEEEQVHLNYFIKGEIQNLIITREQITCFCAMRKFSMSGYYLRIYIDKDLEIIQNVVGKVKLKDLKNLCLLLDGSDCNQIPTAQ